MACKRSKLLISVTRYMVHQSSWCVIHTAHLHSSYQKQLGDDAGLWPSLLGDQDDAPRMTGRRDSSRMTGGQQQGHEMLSKHPSIVPSTQRRTHSKGSSLQQIQCKCEYCSQEKCTCMMFYCCSDLRAITALVSAEHGPKKGTQGLSMGLPTDTRCLSTA